VTTLVAVPNVSEGRDRAALDAIGAAFAAGGARVLDLHADVDHHRSVFTLAGEQGRLGTALAAGTEEALRRIDLSQERGIHPHVGAVDVVPVVHRTDAERGAACAEALVLADLLGDALGAPVLLYGALGGGRTRAELRRGGPEALAARIAAGELVPDAGPRALHPRAGAVLVAARPPLGAFNVRLGPGATRDDARAVAAAIRDGAPGGLPGVRALGLWAGGAQVSTNVEDLERVRLAEVLAAIALRAPVAGAELVAPVPRAALEGWPADVALDAPAPLEALLAV
jgi:glutamate formiminotransferase/glutamate formiminotransferase/formiminotetrahydrofolate cyclodeaminase